LWTKLFEEYAPQLLRSLLARGPLARENANDIVQSTFLRLIERAGRIQFTTGEAFCALMFMTARSVFVDFIRKAEVERRVGEELRILHSQKLEELREEEENAAQKALEAFLRDLREEDQRLFTLRFKEKKSLVEIANELNLSYSATGSRLSRLGDQIRKRLGTK
jgi:RNA polymerase sigma factor (sigma-70 family)